MKFALLTTSAFAHVAYHASGTVPVITIQTKNGPVRINATDYDPNTHKLAEGEQEPAPASISTPDPVVTDPNAQTTPLPATTPATASAGLPGAAAAPAPTIVPVAERTVVKDGKKFYVGDKDGKRLNAEGVLDANGPTYDSDEAARASFAPKA